MSRSGRGVVEHDAARIRGAVNNMPEGVAKAVDKVRELNENAVKQKEDKPIPEGLKNLVLLGKEVEDVVFGEYTFKIATLSSKQQKDILKRFFFLSNEDKLANLKIQTLSEAIVSVNQIPLEELYVGDDDLDVSSKKFEVISQLQANIVDKIFEKFDALNKRTNSIFESGGLDEGAKN
jgi:hypothetical protein